MKKLTLPIYALMIIFVLIHYSCKKEDDNPTITDKDGNVYSTIEIGTQTWINQNLKTTKYNDGEDIPLVTNNTEWINIETPAYCWYLNNEIGFKNRYGALYNWYTVNTGKLCPIGWHVPSYDEWKILCDYLGGEDIAGGKMKVPSPLDWESPNEGATNESGFTALPSGSRSGDIYFEGNFEGSGRYCYWWSSTEYSSSDAYSWYILYINSDLNDDHANKRVGYSVRCIKDN